MDENILKQILEELKKQSESAEKSSRGFEEIQESSKRNIYENKTLIEKQRKKVSVQQYIAILFFIIVIGFFVYELIDKRIETNNIEEIIQKGKSKNEMKDDGYMSQIGFIGNQFRSGYYKEIAENKTQFLERYKYNPDIYYYIGVSLFNIGDIKDSKKYFITSDSLLPDIRNQKYLNAINRRK